MKNGLNSEKSQSLYPFVRKMTKQTEVIIQAYNFVKYEQNYIQSLLLG
jgi:hypothetical protein